MGKYDVFFLILLMKKCFAPSKIIKVNLFQFKDYIILID